MFYVQLIIENFPMTLHGRSVNIPFIQVRRLSIEKFIHLPKMASKQKSWACHTPPTPNRPPHKENPPEAVSFQFCKKPAPGERVSGGEEGRGKTLGG